VVEDSRPPGPFDVRTIRYLAALMSRHDLSEIDLRQGELRILLRRGGRALPPAPAPAAAEAAPAPVAVPTAVTPPAAQPPADKPTKALVTIKSPAPGTFYAAATPGAEPFVRVGARVTPTTVVGVLEAMKIFSEIPAECSGVITAIRVENQQPVEYGQVLFEVDPTA
jgi:acetyl-CoA carboxylase biotin carboxyl carrier protein